MSVHQFLDASRHRIHTLFESGQSALAERITGRGSGPKASSLPKGAPRHRLHASTTTPFARWSDNLYCSGAVDQSCRLADGREMLKGQCYWHKHLARNQWQSVSEADMETAKRPTFVGHRWDPLQPQWPRSGESGFHYFGRDAASRCLQGKRVLVAGDSTTRDTFYELVTVAGHGGLIMRNLPNESAVYWPDRAYAPREPGGTMQDRQGWCMGNHEKRLSCLRDLHIADPSGGPATRFSYQFLT